MKMFEVFKVLLLVLFFILFFMEADLEFVSCFQRKKKNRSRKTSHLEMKIEHFCHCEV